MKITMDLGNLGESWTGVCASLVYRWRREPDFKPAPRLRNGHFFYFPNEDGTAVHGVVWGTQDHARVRIEKRTA